MRDKLNYEKCTFDIEADGLLDKITQIWVIAIHDYQTKEKRFYTDQTCEMYIPSGSLEDGVKELLKYRLKICHNMMGYDYFVLEKFFPNLWNLRTVPFSSCWDTYVQSKAQLFDRPRLKGVKGNHGLEHYGLLLKYPKPPIEDWSYFSEDKLERCLVDIEINTKTYDYLNREASKIGLGFYTQIRRSQASSYWHTKQALNGFKGDADHMKKCIQELDTMLEDLRQEIEPRLPLQLKVKAVKCTWEELSNKWDKFYKKVPPNKYDEDGRVVKEAYMPTTKIFLKSGLYDKHTANWFDITQESSKSDRLIAGAYTKIYFEETRMSQHAQVKDYLLSIGWCPLQWNYQKDKDGKLLRGDRGKLIPKSPKLTEDSFDSIEGELGQKIAQYNTYMHRRRTFKNEKDDTKGWINRLRPDGRISAGANVFNTSTSRSAQYEIVNCPSSSALYGSQMRGTWVADKGKVLISVDQDSSQLRCLANFMGDPIYTNAVLSGEEFNENHEYVGTDPHTLNAQAFGVLSESLVAEARETQSKNLIQQCSDIRKYSKNGIYCYLFGGGDEKLAQTLKLKTAAQGKMIKETFTAKLPAMGELQERLRKMFKENPYGRGGYIQVAGGTWLYCMSEHKLLNYLLMGSEATIQNQAVCWVNNQVIARGLSGKQVLAVHDELTFEFPEEEKEEGIQLLSEMYGVASKKLGMEVLVTGTAQAGYSYLDIH